MMLLRFARAFPIYFACIFHLVPALRHNLPSMSRGVNLEYARLVKLIQYA